MRTLLLRNFGASGALVPLQGWFKGNPPPVGVHPGAWTQWGDGRFRDHFRVTKDAFQDLVDIVHPVLDPGVEGDEDGGGGGMDRAAAEAHVAVVLHKLAHAAADRVSSTFMGIPAGSHSRYFHRGLRAITAALDPLHRPQLTVQRMVESANTFACGRGLGRLGG